MKSAYCFRAFVMFIASRKAGCIRAAAATKCNRFLPNQAAHCLLVRRVCIKCQRFVLLGLSSHTRCSPPNPLLTAALSARSGDVVGRGAAGRIRIGFVRRHHHPATGFWRVFSPYALIPLLSAFMFRALRPCDPVCGAQTCRERAFFWTRHRGAVAITLWCVFWTR